MPAHAPRLRLALGATALTIVAALVGGTVATVSAGGGQSFTDVPPSHQFYDEIEGIVDAGITTGFSSDNTYRPNQAVTRGSMAAFMSRGFGRANQAGASGQSITSDNSAVSLGTAVIEAGAAGGQGGNVVVQADAQFGVAEVDCTCTFVVEIFADGSVVASRTIMTDDVSVVGLTSQGVSVSKLIPIDANTSETYQVRVKATTAGANSTVASANIIATYVPFDFDGNQPA